MSDLEQRIERLENIAAKLCKEVVKGDYSWQSWADPLNEFIKVIESERKENKARAE